MKEYKKNIVISLIIELFSTYLLGWSDLYNNSWITGNIFKDLWKSITYYSGWVLVYWWVFIIIGCILISLFSTAIITFAKNRQVNVGSYQRIALNFIIFIVLIFLVWINRIKH